MPVLLLGPDRATRMGWFRRRIESVDRLIYREIAERRRSEDLEERDDILSLLVAARHEDGSPMSDQEMRDELLTLLVAGHETTATALSWAVERLSRHPRQARSAPRGGRGRRGCLPDGDDPGDAAAAAGDLDRRPPPHRAGRDRRLRDSRRRLRHSLRLPGPRQPGGLSRTGPLPARALPRQPAGHLHLDPLRRRRPPLPRRLLRPVRDGGRARGAGQATPDPARARPSPSGSSAARSPRPRATTPRSSSARCRRSSSIRLPSGSRQNTLVPMPRRRPGRPAAVTAIPDPAGGRQPQSRAVPDEADPDAAGPQHDRRALPTWTSSACDPNR